MFSRHVQLLAAESYVRRRLDASGAPQAAPDDWPAFAARLDVVFPTLCELFAQVYGERPDCLDQLAELVIQAAVSWSERPADLKAIDADRERHPDWFQSNAMLGGVCYVARYAADLDGIRP